MENHTDSERVARFRRALADCSEPPSEYKQLVLDLRGIEVDCMKKISSGQISRNALIDLLQRECGPDYSRSKIIRALTETQIRFSKPRQSSSRRKGKPTRSTAAIDVVEDEAVGAPRSVVVEPTNGSRR